MAEMSTWLRKFKAETEKSATLGENTGQYLLFLEKAYDEAMAIADPLDKYDALSAFGKHQWVPDYGGWPSQTYKSLSSSIFLNSTWDSLHAWEQQQKKNRMVIAATPIAGACALSLLAGAFLPLAWVIAPIVCGASAFKAIQHRNKINAKNSERCAAIAEKIRDRAGMILKSRLDDTIDPVFKAAEDERQRLLKTNPAVDAYARYKTPTPPTRNEIKQSIREQFEKVNTVTPEDLTVDVDSTAKKPSIKLKMGG